MKKYVLYDYLKKQGFYLTQSYGVNKEYYSQFNLLFHEGVDFGNNDKKVILRSPLAGYVILDDDDGRGNYGVNVKIWDDKQLCAVQFGHFDGNFVTHGQYVQVGDPLGEMGGTGNSDGEHIHMNFMITDGQGNRLYNTKSQNWGFLDPQHPYDPNPPLFCPGVEPYTVEWSYPINNSIPTYMTVPEEIYRKLVNGATVRKEVANYYEVENPDNAQTADIIGKIDKTINAYKGQVTSAQSAQTDTERRLAVATQEVINRSEQVSRLKDDMLKQKESYEAQIKAIVESQPNTTEVVKQLQAEKEDYYNKYTAEAKQKGIALNELAEVKKSLEICEKGLPQQQTRSLWDAIIDFLKNTRVIK